MLGIINSLQLANTLRKFHNLNELCLTLSLKKIVKFKMLSLKRQQMMLLLLSSAMPD